MSTSFGRTRSSIELRKSPAPNSKTIGGLGPGVPVEVLAEQDGWLQIQPAGMQGAVPGYAPTLAVAIPGEPLAPVFPQIEVEEGKPPLPSVPHMLKASELAGWLTAGGKMTWIPDDLWLKLELGQQDLVASGVRAAIQGRQAEWEGWLAEVQGNGRREEATLGEWFTILQGGQNMWAMRAERVFREPSNTSEALGWIGVDDILFGPGHIFRNAQDGYQDWQQVSIYKLGKALNGWFRSDLLEAYIFPTALNDPDNAQNASLIFDLATPMLRFPVDPEITQTLAVGYSAAQYIDIRAVTGKALRHFNLCGEFCVAALVGSDVIPLLKQWKASYAGAAKILNNNCGTTTLDLNSILKLFNREGESYRYSPSALATTPQRIKDLLSQGQMAIAGVVINGRGVVDAKGNICHWVVLEDALPVGTGGWVRIYNPFMNREEVYSYDVFIASMTKFPLGLWIPMPGHDRRLMWRLR